MSGAVMEASVALGLISIGLAGILFALYRRVYVDTRSGFGLALLVFAGAFVVQNLLVVYSYLATMPLIPGSLSPYLFAIGVTEAAGLGAILWTALN